jgi:hypothetical protein
MLDVDEGKRLFALMSITLPPTWQRFGAGFVARMDMVAHHLRLKGVKSVSGKESKTFSLCFVTSEYVIV